jgi:hypothetical protein
VVFGPGAGSKLKKAQELSAQSQRYATADRTMRIKVKNLAQPYILQRYSLDSGCSRDCSLSCVEEKEVTPGTDGSYEEILTLKPYSVSFIQLKPRPAPQAPEPVTASIPAAAAVEVKEQPAGNGGYVMNATAAGTVNATQAVPATNSTDTK